MGSLQTSILHSDGKWVQRRSKPEISYEFLLRGIQYQRKSLIAGCDNGAVVVLALDWRRSGGGGLPFSRQKKLWRDAGKG
eukprot:scaffold32730_cov36-Cyclotella_meneghiniana.AAC.5